MRWARRLQCSSVKREYVLTAQVRAAAKPCQALVGQPGPLWVAPASSTQRRVFFSQIHSLESRVCTAFPRLSWAPLCRAQNVCHLWAGGGGGGPHR